MLVERGLCRELAKMSGLLSEIRDVGELIVHGAPHRTIDMVRLHATDNNANAPRRRQNLPVGGWRRRRRRARFCRDAAHERSIPARAPAGGRSRTGAIPGALVLRRLDRGGAQAKSGDRSSGFPFAPVSNRMVARAPYCRLLAAQPHRLRRVATNDVLRSVAIRTHPGLLELEDSQAIQVSKRVGSNLPDQAAQR